MRIDENDTIIVSQDNIEEIETLSRCVVICLEIISSFSIDGKYISSDIPNGRMSYEEANNLYITLYNKLLNLNAHKPKKLQEMKSKKLLKIIKPALPFVLGIYRNGTPNYRFQSMRADEKISDDYILEQFAFVYKERIVKGYDYLLKKLDTDINKR